MITSGPVSPSTGSNIPRKSFKSLPNSAIATTPPATDRPLGCCRNRACAGCSAPEDAGLRWRSLRKYRRRAGCSSSGSWFGRKRNTMAQVTVAGSAGARAPRRHGDAACTPACTRSWRYRLVAWGPALCWSNKRQHRAAFDVAQGSAISAGGLHVLSNAGGGQRGRVDIGLSGVAP
jgi:hypothetical protein